MGLFAGRRPSGLGFHNGRFKPPSWKPNCVSSTVTQTDTKHYIAPLRITGNPVTAWQRLLHLLKEHPSVQIVEQREGYVYTEFKSRLMGFVDDVEFALDPQAGVIHMRSASRLGIRDFGVNRQRLEGLRTRMG